MTNPVKRYEASYYEPHEAPDGEWVRYEDYEKLMREVAAGEQEIAMLKSANPGLGDEAAWKEALRDLFDEQNGPPLETRREQWQRAFDRARDLLVKQP